MGVRFALVAILMMVVGLTDGASVTALAQQPTPRAPAAPGGQGGTGDGPRQRPGRPMAPNRPTRDPRAPQPEGTATIRGRVVDAATGAAISRAKVRTGGRDPRQARVATTDAEGMFTLTKVPSGVLYLSAEKPTYLIAAYPDRRRSMRGGGVTVAASQTIDNITIQMQRGGAITGRVVDAYGDPAENVTVHAIPAAQSDRSMQQMLMRSGGMRSFQGSNDIGEFRVSRLEPGQYYLVANPQRRPFNAEDGTTAVARTFYPGVSSIEQAQPVTVERGQDITGITFQLLDTTLTRVSGFVITSKGTPATRGHVSARNVGASKGMPAGGGFMSEGGFGAGIENGGFEMMLQPGEYLIEAMAAPDDVPSMNSMEMDRGQVRLMVSGEAMNGVTIATGRGGTVTGKFVFNGRNAQPPTSFQGFNIGFTGPNAQATDDCRSFNRPVVNPDGTFTAENMWGTCQIRGGGSVRGWAFEAIMHNGNDITNRVIEFGAGKSISGVEIVYSDRVADLAVTVTDDRGTPVPDYVAVAFPVDKEKWTDQRFMRFQVTAAASGFGTGNGDRILATSQASGMPAGADPGMSGSQATAIRTLLAGDYYVVALEDVAPEDLRETEFMERLSQLATRVSVNASGSAQPVQLRRITLPD